MYDPSRTKTIVAKLGTERTHVFFDLNTQKESADKSTQDKDVQPTIGEGFEAEKITNTPLEEFGDNGVDDKANLIMLHTDGCNTMRAGLSMGSFQWGGEFRKVVPPPIWGRQIPTRGGQSPMRGGATLCV